MSKKEVTSGLRLLIDMIPNIQNGTTILEIAKILQISPRSVEDYLRDICADSLHLKNKSVFIDQAKYQQIRTYTEQNQSLSHTQSRERTRKTTVGSQTSGKVGDDYLYCFGNTTEPLVRIIDKNLPDLLSRKLPLSSNRRSKST